MGRGRHADSPSGSSQHSLSKHNKSQFGSTSSLAASSVSTVTHAAIDTGSLSPVHLCHLGTYFLDVKAQSRIIYFMVLSIYHSKCGIFLSCLKDNMIQILY